MAKITPRSALIDALLEMLATGTIVGAMVFAPNSLKLLEKPLQKLTKNLDANKRERELRNTIRYMKRRGLITQTSEDYQHGLIITKAGKRRLKNVTFEQLRITKPPLWDKKWRIVFFDVPETNKTGRDLLTSKLKQLGFKQLQRSVWIHPFPCLKEIEATCEHYSLSKYVTYIETSYVYKEALLKDRFKSLLK